MEITLFFVILWYAVDISCTQEVFYAVKISYMKIDG